LSSAERGFAPRSHRAGSASTRWRGLMGETRFPPCRVGRAGFEPATLGLRVASGDLTSSHAVMESAGKRPFRHEDRGLGLTWSQEVMWPQRGPINGPPLYHARASPGGPFR
jgi:hypothetical protein